MYSWYVVHGCRAQEGIVALSRGRLHGVEVWSAEVGRRAQSARSDGVYGIKLANVKRSLRS